MVNGRFLGRPATGVDRTALELIRALAALQEHDGFEVSVVVPPQLVDRAIERLEDGIAVDVLGRDLPGHVWEQVHLGRHRPEAWLIGLCNTGPIVRRRQAVLVHDAQFRTHANSYSRAFRYAYSLLVPILTRRATCIYTVSRYSRSVLEQERLAPAGQLSVIPNGCDHMDRVESDASVLERHGLTAEAYFLAVGSPAPHKNLDTLYRAVQSAGELDYPLVVVGDTDSRVLRRTAGAADDRVRGVGRVTDAELKALYQSARALCLPSLTEGFGLPAVEAMRCGTPVVAARAGALPEVCGEAAILVEPLDIQAWRDALRRLEVDREFRSQLRSAGLTRSEQFQWRISARLIIESIRAHEAMADHEARLLDPKRSTGCETPSQPPGQR